MNRLVLVRHGETQWNSDNRVQGSVDVPLSEKGRVQAREVAAALSARGFRFGAIFSSDLLRAAETAGIIAEEMNIGVPRTDPLLRELHCGEWEGEPFALLHEAHPADFERWLKDPGFRIPGGESMMDVCRRAGSFFEARKKSLDETDEVLLVAHGLFNRMVLSVLTGIEPQKCRFFAQDNAAFNLLEFRGEQAWCLAWNVAR